MDWRALGVGGGQGSVTVCVAVGGTGRVARVGESRGGLVSSGGTGCAQKEGSPRGLHLPKQEGEAAWLSLPQWEAA